MRLHLRTLLLALIATVAAATVRANGLHMTHGTPYGPLFGGYAWDWWWLVIPTVVIEYIVLLAAFRPRKPGRFALIVAGVHLVSYPITAAISVYVLWFAELLAIAIEYTLYKKINARLIEDGGMGQRWRGGGYAIGRVLLANFLSFLVGAVVFLDMHSIGPSTRSPVARAKADMRSIATAIESYMVDTNAYPTNLDILTTPISYMIAMPIDVLGPRTLSEPHPRIRYVTSNNNWLLWSAGPDRDYDIDPAHIERLFNDTASSRLMLNTLFQHYTYDPTNGTYSNGDVWRIRQ